MNILMMTNTYLPFVGGVERSVETYSEEYRKRGHRVVIVAPTFEGAPEDETDVIRVPAIQHFNGTDFSVQLPVPGILNSALKNFKPHIIHSHHPYLVGDSALRLAAHYEIPIVFTFHTFYEKYTHYVPGDSPALKRFVTKLATGYANLCDLVIAPSRSVSKEISRRGVYAPVEVIPTGIPVKRFARGDRHGMRRRCGIPQDAFVVGFVSRLAPEKNVSFLADAVGDFLLENPRAHFLVAGNGPSREEMVSRFQGTSFRGRFHFPGTLQGQDLIDTYHAMDAFAFASDTETQGLVLTEALASGIPVVSLKVPVVDEVVRDGYNGYLVEDREAFRRALQKISRGGSRLKTQLKTHAVQSVSDYDKGVCARKALEKYETLLGKNFVYRDHADSNWSRAMRMIRAELELIRNMTKATGAAFNNQGG
ncbi:MAG: glycosyltransferase [Chitinispirillaceae bacterium]